MFKFLFYTGLLGALGFAAFCLFFEVPYAPKRTEVQIPLPAAALKN